MRIKSRLLVIILSLLLVVTVLGGCKPAGQGNPDTGKDSETQPPKPVTVEVTLYFSDDQAEFLVPEKREVTIEKQSDELLARKLVEELVAGPASIELQPTIPADSKVLSVNINDGVASVDLSNEIKSKHPGGSAGETMTIFSLVNSLTEIDSIEKVQLLIEGQTVESLAGHLDISKPIERNEDIIKK